MPGQLVLHCGGWEATKADLAAVPVPVETDSYVPVPHGRFLEEVELHVPRFGLTVTEARYALARDGMQMFAVLTCSNGDEHADYALAIGVRNSYDRSLCAGLVAGSHVFCCDNLAFSGEAAVARKHTAHVFRDLPDLIYRMLSKVASLQGRIHAEVAAMKARELLPEKADHLIVEAIRRRALPASNLPRVLDAWDRPRHEEFMPRTAWSLYNAFTETAKSRSPRAQVEGTLRLTRAFRDLLSL
ncbi:MAG: DUF932 domain-containing protein [Armatimonadetes bacterium]|nr:DUF932 domain-containing protein [Armatimonadota bacterium]